MTGRRVLIAAATALSLGAAVSGQTPEAVSVDVWVRSATASTSLTANDFILLDNNVKQRIDRVEPATGPVDLSLIVDVSGGPPEFWGRTSLPAEVTEKFAALVRKVSALLRQDDRLRLFTVDTYASQATAATAIASNGRSSLHDALVAAMLLRVESGRRHVIIALTKGEDTISPIDGAAVQEVARRSGAVLHVVQGDSLVGNTKCVFGCTPSRRFWTPFRRQDFDRLAEIARSTGGAFHGLDDQGFDRDVADESKNILDDVRRGYALRYVPQGVKRDGWHDIKVSLPAAPTLTVTVRRGYSLEAPAPPPAPAPALPATVSALVHAFERGEYAAMHNTLRQSKDVSKVIRDFREAGNPWPDAPRREAVFVLDLAAVAFEGEDDAARDEAVKLLQQYAALVRQPAGADTFECGWHWAEVTLLEGMGRPALAMPFVTRAVERCHDQGRFLLAYAVVSDQRMPGASGTPGTPGTRGTAQMNDVIARYDAAIASKDTELEARVRKAWFLHRSGRFEDALAVLDGSPRVPNDAETRYWTDLVRGHILRALGRIEPAAAAYRAALADWPGAQSARVALMTLLATAGQRRDAEVLAEDIQAAPAQASDPWWWYWQGDYYVYPQIIGRLREAVR